MVVGVGDGGGDGDGSFHTNLILVCFCNVPSVLPSVASCGGGRPRDLIWF